MKSLAYAEKLATINALEAIIVSYISDIQLVLLEKVAKYWSPRMRFIKKSRGAHMAVIILNINAMDISFE